jgi:hypothetical protein
MISTIQYDYRSLEASRPSLPSIPTATMAYTTSLTRSSPPFSTSNATSDYSIQPQTIICLGYTTASLSCHPRMRAAHHRGQLQQISYPTSRRIGVRKPTAWRASSGLRAGERKPSVFLHVEVIETDADFEDTSLESREFRTFTVVHD